MSGAPVSTGVLGARQAARALGVSQAALRRAGMSREFSVSEVQRLGEHPPEWLVAQRSFVTQAYRFALDPTPAQERALTSHCGASRFAYNWGLALVKDRLERRERVRGAATGSCSTTRRSNDCRARSRFRGRSRSSGASGTSPSTSGRRGGRRTAKSPTARGLTRSRARSRASQT